MIYKLGSEGSMVATIQQKLARNGYDPGDDLTGVFGAHTEENVRLFQAKHRDESGKPLDTDGVVGDRTMWALTHASDILPADEDKKRPIIQLKAVRLPYYRDLAEHTFWLNAEVADSFMEGITEWKATGGKYIVTETFRSIAAQAAAHRRKPGLCTEAGWSMHGHGRAVDGHVRPEDEAALKRFWTIMAKYGWYTIFNFPGKPLIFKSREAWHIQKTDPVGIKSHAYLEKWAKSHGGIPSLLNVKYQKIG